jgi:hypothetical protein
VQYTNDYHTRYKLKEDDFTMTVNLYLEKKVYKMIKEIVEKDIKSQISEKMSKKYEKN